VPTTAGSVQWLTPDESVAARSTPYTSRVTPSVPVTAPVRSNRPDRVAGSGSARGASSTSAIPIGTLTSSTQRQDSHVVIAPPATSPSGLPIDAIAVYAPRARARGGPSANVAAISDSAAGDAPAAPTPCSARQTSSCHSSWASPPSSDAMLNSTSPATNTRRRPRMSPARPPSSSRPPKATD
jgi:hypothetical protein